MKKLLLAIDGFLNSITMYRLLIYGLSLLITAAVIFSYTGQLSFSQAAIRDSLAVLLATCYIANRCLAVIFEADSNSESWLITALILCFVLPPETSFHKLTLIALGGLIAMASKYVIAYRHKHLFNPAAFAALILGLTSILPAIWWIGTPAMLIPTTILGVLVLRKLRRFQLFFSFLIASLVVAVAVGLRNSETPHYIISTAFRSSPLMFLGSIMLTEPATSPPSIWQQRIYGLIVGAVFTSQLRLGSVSTTPELALIIGNLYAFIVSPKYKLQLHFKERKQLTPQTYELIFAGSQHLNFQPGQYLEWTLPHKPTDSRGNRRTFSIASAPGGKELKIAIKNFEGGSSFKKALLSLRPGDSITAGQLGGNFLLPSDPNTKLVFVAGGIGITPFVSMIENMIKTDSKRDIVMFYLASQESDFSYGVLWRKASDVGVKFVPVVTSKERGSKWKGQSGYLTEKMLSEEVPDYLERVYYLSGPNALVTNYRSLLRQLKIPRKSIRTDYFSGY